MKPNYKNWMPKGMICGTAAGCAVCLVLFHVFGVSGLLTAGIWKTVLALTIAVAKHNPNAQMTGIDRWGVEYSSFSKTLCEENAKAEGVSNTSFAKGDAVRLNFADETFDAVCSNYVYHNIPSRNRQEILMETLRVLKKGGTFAIHDIFSNLKYGDMQLFVQRLKDMGYADVKLVPTDNGLFMSRCEATWLGLKGSAILMGKK